MRHHARPHWVPCPLTTSRSALLCSHDCVLCCCVASADEYRFKVDKDGNISVDHSVVTPMGAVTLSRKSQCLLFAAMDVNGKVRSIELDISTLTTDALEELVNEGYGLLIDEARLCCDCVGCPDTTGAIMAMVLKRCSLNAFTFVDRCDPRAAIVAATLSAAFCPLCLSKGSLYYLLEGGTMIKYCDSPVCRSGGTINGEKSELTALPNSMLEQQLEELRRLKLPEVATAVSTATTKRSTKKRKGPSTSGKKTTKKVKSVKQSVVRAVVGKRDYEGATQHSVEWDGCDDEGASYEVEWLDEGFLNQCSELVHEYDRLNGGCRTEGCTKTPTLSCPHHKEDCDDYSCTGPGCVGACSKPICVDCAKTASVTCKDHLKACEVCLSRGNRHAKDDPRIKCSGATCGKMAIGDCCPSAFDPVAAVLADHGEKMRVSNVCIRCGPCVNCRRTVDDDAAEVRCSTCGRQSHFACDPHAAVVHGFEGEKFECSACYTRCMVCFVEATSATDVVTCQNCEGIACDDCATETYEDEVCVMCCLGMRSGAAFIRRTKMEGILAKALAEGNVTTKKIVCAATARLMKETL